MGVDKNKLSSDTGPWGCFSDALHRDRVFCCECVGGDAIRGPDKEHICFVVDAQAYARARSRFCLRQILIRAHGAEMDGLAEKNIF